MKNEYAELRRRNQEQLNAVPFGFAFGRDQFIEMMQKWGLNPDKDIDKIYSLGAGTYVQKKDMELFRTASAKVNAEFVAAIDADKTGEGFIYQMFLYELDNHEYGYTFDAGDTLDALGYTEEEVLSNPQLKRGFEKAVKEILKREVF